MGSGTLEYDNIFSRGFFLDVSIKRRVSYFFDFIFIEQDSSDCNFVNETLNSMIPL